VSKKVPLHTRAACRRKVKYGSKEAAKRAAYPFPKSKQHNRALALRPYRCKACGQWHLAKPTRKPAA
jgi:predicted Zn-ribbon and HTH transcriptional regulator